MVCGAVIRGVVMTIPGAFLLKVNQDLNGKIKVFFTLLNSRNVLFGQVFSGFLGRFSF